MKSLELDPDYKNCMRFVLTMFSLGHFKLNVFNLTFYIIGLTEIGTNHHQHPPCHSHTESVNAADRESRRVTAASLAVLVSFRLLA